MNTKIQNNFSPKIVVLSLVVSFTLFGMQESKNIFHSSMSVKQAQDNVSAQADSCCQNCSDENCSCCTHHKENKNNNSKDCACQVSKDMTDKPLSVPENINLPVYYSFHTAFSLLTNPQLKNSYILNLKSSIGHSSDLKVIRSTVLLI
ncbi:MAG: hypothetical protein M1480_00180 [Bacteroidetes bacterium]|nr:hypothetical protein [Bacteroidota bacterium]